MNELIAIIRNVVPPHTQAAFVINKPKLLVIHFHGIHGAGKTTTAKKALALLPDYTYVDENYDRIKDIVNSGSPTVERDIMRMLDDRVLPPKSLVDRSSIDCLAYDMARGAEEPAPYHEALLKYHMHNHVWLLPNNPTISRDNVLRRNRPWDDSVLDPYYTKLHNCYVYLSQIHVKYQRLSDIYAALIQSKHPEVDLWFITNKPDSPVVVLHGVHGSGKTTTAKKALAMLPGCSYVDENYDSIKDVVSKGGPDTYQQICDVFAARIWPEYCIIDRDGLDALAYKLSETHTIDPDDLHNMCKLDRSVNHVWFIPFSLDVARRNVKARNRKWDASTDDPVFSRLHRIYKELYHLF